MLGTAGSGRPSARSRLGAFVAGRTDGVVALGLTILAVLLFCMPGLYGPLNRDPGVYLYGGQQVAEGVPPYVGVLNRAGPLAHLVPGAGVLLARWVGADDVIGVRVPFLLIAGACVGVAYLLGRAVFASRHAGVVAAFMLLAMHGFALLAVAGPSEKTVMVLLLQLALLAGARGRWLVAGVLVALATLTWQPVFFPAFTGVVAMALLRRPEPGAPTRLAAVVRIAVGGLAPTAVAVLAYLLVGQLRTALDAFLLINVGYTKQRTFLGDAATSLETIRNAYGLISPVIAAGLVAAVVLAVVAGRRPGRHTPTGAATIGLGSATVAGVLWTLWAFQGYPDLFVLLPLAGLGAGGLVALVAARLPVRAGVAVTTAVAVLLGASATAWAVRQPVARGLLGQRAIAASVLDAVPDPRVVSVNAPSAMAILETRSLTRYQMFRAGLGQYYMDNLPGGLPGYRDRVRRLHPDLVVIGKTFFEPKRWTSSLAGDYTYVGQAYGWLFLASVDLPAEQRRALREALDAFDRADYRS